MAPKHLTVEALRRELTPKLDQMQVELVDLRVEQEPHYVPFTPPGYTPRWIVTGLWRLACRGRQDTFQLMTVLDEEAAVKGMAWRAALEVATHLRRDHREGRLKQLPVVLR